MGDVLYCPVCGKEMKYYATFHFYECPGGCGEWWPPDPFDDEDEDISEGGSLVAQQKHSRKAHEAD